MKNRSLKWILLLLVLLLLFFGGRSFFPADESAPAAVTSPAAQSGADAGPLETLPDASVPDEDGVYTARDELALYLHVYGHLPYNFITKSEAREAGWNGGSLEASCPGKCIGGDRFGNREGLLPDAPGRVWYECDVNTLGARSRGAERLVYSSDGLIYYTGDHYESYELLYGESS